MATVRRARRQLNTYRLSIICPALALNPARREIRTVLMDCGLKARQWHEEAMPAGPSAAWMVRVEFKSQSENCMHFLQQVAARLKPLPRVRLRLDCLPPPAALPRHAARVAAPG